MSKKDEINKKENEKFHENLLLLKKERELCIDGAKKVNKNLNDIEKVYHDESYDIILANEAAQMERLLSSVEINSLKACSALEEVNNELSKLALEQISDPKRDEIIPQGNSQIEEFLSTQDSELLQKATKIKMDAAAARLKDIFLKATKQYNNVLATFSSVSHDQHDNNNTNINTNNTNTNNTNINTNIHNDDHDRRDIEDHQLSHITNLQKRIKELKKELEIAEMKSRSVIVQRGVDLQKAKEEKARYEAETRKLLLKLQLSESKRRFHEQLGRDENHSTTLVSPMEYEEVQRECQELKEQIIALQDEAVKREQTILQLTQELATTQHNYQTSEYNKNKLQSKIDELSKKEKYSQDRIDDVIKEYEKKFNDLEMNFENELRDYRTKLKDYESVTKEKMRLTSHVMILEEEEKKMKTQSKEFMTQLTDARKRITTLEEQIITQENEYAKTLQLLEVKLMEKAMERAMSAVQDKTLSQQNSTIDDNNLNQNNNDDNNENDNFNELKDFDEIDNNSNNNNIDNNNNTNNNNNENDLNEKFNSKINELELEIEKLKQENNNFQQEINHLNNQSVQLIEKTIPIEVTKEIIPDNIISEINNLNETINNLNKLLINKDKEHELNIKSLSQQHVNDIDNVTIKFNTLQNQYDQLQQQFKELSSLTDNESSDILEPALKIKQMKLNTKSRKLSGSNNSFNSKEDTLSSSTSLSLLSPTNKKEISIQTDEDFIYNKIYINQNLQTDDIFISTISERENELNLHKKEIENLKESLNNIEKSTKKSNRMLSMQSSSFQINEIDSYDWNDDNSDNNNDNNNNNNHNNNVHSNNIGDDKKTNENNNNNNNNNNAQDNNNNHHHQQQQQQISIQENILEPLNSKDLYDMIEKLTNEHFDNLLKSENFDSLFTPLKEENNEKLFQQSILNLFLHPVNGLMHQHIIEHEQKKGKKHKIHDIITCVLDMMDKAILKYLEISHFEETRAELESKVDLVINLENELSKLQSDLDSALLTVDSTKSALSALSLDIPSSSHGNNNNNNNNNGREDSPQIDLLKKNLSFSGIDLLKLKPEHLTPLDDISSTRSLESNDNDDNFQHNTEITRRMSKLDNHILDTEKHIIRNAKEDILQLKNELDELQNNYNMLSEKYDIILDENEKYKSIFNDMNNSIPIDERSNKSGFDFSKYLALASTDNQDEPKKSRAQTLLELSKPRSIDRTQTINLSKSSSSSSSLPSSALNTQRRDSKQLKNLKNQNNTGIQYNSIASVSEDDDISLLDDPDFNDYYIDDNDINANNNNNQNNNNINNNNINNNNNKIKDKEKYLIAKERKLLREFLNTDKYGSENELTESLGMIKSEHFDKLINGPFGGNDLIHLTRLEFYHRNRYDDDGDNDTVISNNNSNYNNNIDDDMSQSSDNISSTSGSISKKNYKNIKMNSNLRKKTQNNQQQSIPQYNYKSNNKILQKAAEIEIGAQRKLVIEHYPISELAKFLHATESTLLKLNTFSVWKRIKFATAGGMFHDILVVHRDSINRCIATAGGYSQAMLTIQIENQVTSNTDFWPEFFRVKVLEYYRKELLTLNNTHEKEIKDLQDTVIKLRNDLQDEKELITQERAWALKEISSMSVHLQKRLVMSRASTFNEVDIKELSDALGEPHSGDNDDDDYFKDSTQSTPLNTTSTNSVSTPTKKIKKSVMFQDPTGLNFSTRLYDENSSFYLKAQEIHKSLKAKQFFKRIVHSHSLLQSYQRRHSSFDEFADSNSEKNKSITTTPNTSMNENDEKNDDNDKKDNKKDNNKLKMKVRHSKNDSDNDTLESNSSILETVQEKKDDEDDIKEQNSKEIIPNVSIGELLSKSKDDNDNDDGDETDFSDHDEIGEVNIKQGISPPRSNQPLMKRNNSRVIEQITINIPLLLYQLQDIALAIYRNSDKLAAQLAQKLTSVLYNWEESDHTPTSLSACLTLCRPNTSDNDCISLLRDFALSTECNLKLSDLTPVREILHDALIYYESKNGSPTKTRPPTIQSWSQDEHDNSNNNSHHNSNDNYDKISTPKNNSSHTRSTSPTISSRKNNNGLCNSCGKPLQKSLSGEKTPSETARDSEDESISSSRSSFIHSARNHNTTLSSSSTTTTTPGRRKSSHQLNQQSVSPTPTASPKHSPRRKIDNTEYIKKKKMHKKSLTPSTTSSSTTVTSAVKEDLLEELVVCVESKACQTESLENVIISYNPEDNNNNISSTSTSTLISINNNHHKNKDDIPSGELMLVKLAHNIWDKLKNLQDLSQESFSSFGVEISPGIRLISNYILCRKESTLNPNDPDGPRIQSQEFDLKRLPLGIVLVRKRKSSTHLFKGIVEWSDWDSMGILPPELPDDIITVALPPVLEISPAVQLLTSGQMNYFIEIPTDVWIINILRDPNNRVATTFMAELDVLIPSGFLMVKLSPTLIVSKELQKRLPEGVKLAEINPHEMIKLHGRYTLLPPGYMLCPGIMVAAPECSPPPREELVHLDEILTIKNSSMLNNNNNNNNNNQNHLEIKRDIYNQPTDQDDLHIENLYPMVLPPGIIAIYIDKDSLKEFPSYLKLLKCEDETIIENIDDVEIGVDQDIQTYLQRGSIVVLQYPKHLILPTGTILIKRPKSLHGIPRPLPPTMSLCPPSIIPDRLILKDGIELVMLTPIYELPSGIHITPESVIYPRPTGLKLPSRGILVRRSPGAYIPHDIILGNIPPIPYGIYLPPEIELWILPKGLRLPPKAELSDGIYISDYLPQSNTFDDSKYDGIYFIKRDPDYLQAPLPFGFERALKQHLPIGCLLPPGVEAIRLRPRYELPAGILIQSGAHLGKDIQLPPGSEIYPNVEVIEWSQGMYLPQNIELVRRIDRDIGLPNDLTIVQENSDDFQNNDSYINNTPPRGCFFIRLPHKINLPSALELADRCMIVNFKPNNNNNNNGNNGNNKLNYINLPENVIAIKRVPPTIKSLIQLSPMGNIPLPPELTPFPPSLIPKDLHLPAGVELVYVHTRYDLPVGTILTGGIVVHSRCEVNDNIPLELLLTTKSSIQLKDNKDNKDNHNKDQKNKLKFRINPKVSTDSLINIPMSDLKDNLQTILLTKINEHILSWGENCQDLNPIDPPSSMVKLPEGYFLINSSKDGKNLSKLPPSLEIVHDLSPLPHGITLPPRVIVIRLKPKIILPFGIRLSNPNLSSLQNIHLCPGEPLIDPQTEISYHQSTIDDSHLHILISDPLNVSKPFKEVEIQTQTIIFPSLIERLKSWFKYSRLNNVGISTRGHGGVIYGLIPPPIHQINQNDDFINRTPSTPMYSQTRRPVSRTTSRMSDFAADSEDFDNDLLQANEQIEKLNESLDETMKENRILKKTIEGLTKDYETMKSKSIRMEQSRDDMMDECNNMKTQLETIKAKEKKDESAYRIKMSELILANKNLNFTIQEHEDTIKSLKKTVDHMKVNGSMTEKEKEKEFKKRELDLINARDEAISEYRKLLKISIRTAYQLVRAVISTAEKDQHALTFTPSLTRQQNNIILKEEYQINDDISQLTLEDNIDEMSINSFTQGDFDNNNINNNNINNNSTSLIQQPPPELLSNTTTRSLSSGIRSSQSRLPQLSSGRPTPLQPVFRTGTSNGSINSINNNGLNNNNNNNNNLLITSKIGKKKEIKTLLTNSQSTPSITIHDNPSYALASSIVDKIEQQDNISLGTPSIQSKSQKTIGTRSQTSIGGSRSSNGLFLTSSTEKNLLSLSTPLPLNSNNVSISGTGVISSSSASSTLNNKNNHKFNNINSIPLKEHTREIELLDKEVLTNSSLNNHTIPPSESDLSLISPNKFLEDLEKTFNTTKKQVTIHENGEDITSTILVYVVDTASADSIASEWLKNAVSLVVSAISSTLGNYVSAFHLIESEIECHISERKRLHKKLQYIENLYQDYLTSCDIPIEKRLQFRLDEINKTMLDMYSHTENIRNLSYQTILDSLKSMTSDATNYLEQEKRLKLSSIIVKKKALLEETKLKRGTFDEKERIAITHYINSLKKRSVILLSRANTVNEQFQSISNSIKKEFESLEGAVQGILPPNLISKILQWSSIHMQRSLRDPYIIQPSSSISNISINTNEMKNDSMDSNNNYNNNLSMTPTMLTPINNNNNNNHFFNNSSTNFHQKLSLSKPSPNLNDQMIPKEKLNKITELNELTGLRKGLPSVKPDPFNRYFTSNDVNNSNNNNNVSSNNSFGNGKGGLRK